MSTADQIADRIIKLINSSPRSPRKDEIVAVVTAACVGLQMVPVPPDVGQQIGQRIDATLARVTRETAAKCASDSDRRHPSSRGHVAYPELHPAGLRPARCTACGTPATAWTLVPCIHGSRHS